MMWEGISSWCCVKKIEPPKPVVKTIEVKPPTTTPPSQYTKPATNYYTRVHGTPRRPPSTPTPIRRPIPTPITGVKISPFPKPTCPLVCPEGYVRVRL